MKLYHATPIENKESILQNQLNKMVTDKMTLSEEQIQDEGVFGFDNLDSAIEFGEDCCGGEFAVFSFDTQSAVIDPEYDGEAFFTTSYNNLKFVQ